MDNFDEVIVRLSGTEKITIKEAEWPVVASASRRVLDKKRAVADSRWIFVRRHSDGRHLIYGGLLSIQDTKVRRENHGVFSNGEISKVIREVIGRFTSGNWDGLIEECLGSK